MKRSSTRPRAGLQAFNLVELLVVIGIIGLLVSVLIPTIASARHAANTLKCEANLRAIGQVMAIYASENHNAIVGAPVNTGGGAVVLGSNNPGWPPSFTAANFPPVVNQVWDWETPMLKIWGITVPYDGLANATRTNSEARWNRVQFELQYGIFNCPEYDLTSGFYNNLGATYFPGVPNLPSFLKMPSYTIPICFMVLHNPLPVTSSDPGATPTVYGNFYENPPLTYVPRVDKIGPPAEKIYCSDGGRYVFSANGAPSQVWDPLDGEGGEYADWGADSAYTRAQNREKAPGNGGKASLQDERPLWARHGPLLHSVLANQFKFNAVFFDGHVETLGDLEGANPVYWMPRGTVISPNEFWPDVYGAFYINPNLTYICPR